MLVQFIILLSLTGTRFEPVWPLSLRSELTSTFGEFRGMRYHTGIDFSTHHEIGFEVYAIEDGQIVRINQQRYGYGKAVYIKHPNGYYSVYGHLDRFENRGLKLEDLIARKYPGKRYPGKIFGLSIPVQRGQIIAYTGQSGAGPPHLHLEIRDQNNIPINPYPYFSNKLKDTTPPVIKALYLESEGPNDLINGKPDRLEVKLKSNGTTYKPIINKPPVLTGRIKLSANIFDRLTNENTGGIFSYTASEPLNHVYSYEKLSWGEMWRAGLDFDQARTAFHPPNMIYRIGTLVQPENSPPEKIFQWKLIASDFADNSLEVVLPFRWSQVEKPMKPDKTLPLSAYMAGKQSPVYTPSQSIQLSLDNITLSIPKGALLSSSPMWLEQVSVGQNVQGLRKLRQEFAVAPIDLSLKKKGKLRVVLPAITSKTKDIYLYQKDFYENKWQPVATTQCEGWIEAEIRQGGLYCVFKDVTPPIIRTCRPLQLWEVKCRPVAIEVGDDGLGVDETQSAFYVDGELVTAEFDSDTELYEPIDQHFSPGIHEAIVIIADYGGNTTVSELFTFDSNNFH